MIVEEHVVPAGRGDLAGPLGLDLTNNICQIDKTIRVFAGTLAHDLNGLDRRHWDGLQKGDQLCDRGKPEDIDPFDQFCLSGLTQGTDYLREASLLGCQGSRQDAAYGTKTTVQCQLPQQDRPAQVLGSEHTLRCQHGTDDREIKIQLLTSLASDRSYLRSQHVENVQHFPYEAKVCLHQVARRNQERSHDPRAAGPAPNSYHGCF